MDVFSHYLMKHGTNMIEYLELLTGTIFRKIKKHKLENAFKFFLQKTIGLKEKMIIRVGECLMVVDSLKSTTTPSNEKKSLIKCADVYANGK